MSFSKVLLFSLLLVVIFIPQVRNSVLYTVQSAMISSGIVDASAAPETKADRFDFDFAVKDLTGNSIDFKTFKGKVIFLNLWATWCGPCRSEMPSIQELYGQVDKKDIAFVMLSLDEDRLTEKVKRYVREKEFTFPVYMTLGATTNQLAVDVIPSTFVISKDGTIVLKERGMKNYNTSKFKKFLEQLAAK